MCPSQFADTVRASALGGFYMLVRMKTGDIENLLDDVAKAFILQGRAEPLVKDAAVLIAENHGGAAATVGIEMAVVEPKVEHAVVKFFRTLRSRG